MAGPCSDKHENFTPLAPGDWGPSAVAWTPLYSGNTRDFSAFGWKGLDPAQTVLTAGVTKVDSLNVMDFSAGVGADVDDADRIQCAIDAARFSGICAVYLPRRTYLLHKPLTIVTAAKESVRLFSDFAVLKAAPGAGAGYPKDQAMLDLQTKGPRLIIENLVLHAGCEFGRCIRAKGVNTRMSSLVNVRVGFATSDGVYLEGCQVASIRGCSSDYNGGNGWTFDGCTAMSVIACRARRNAGHGFETFASEGYTGGNFLSHIVSEKNGGCGLWAWEGTNLNKYQHSSGLRLRDSVIDGNAWHGVRVEAWDACVSGVTFRPGSNPDARWAWVGHPATGVVIRDCSVARSTLAPRFHAAHDEVGRARHVSFERNYGTEPEGALLGEDVASIDASRVVALSATMGE